MAITTLSAVQSHLGNTDASDSLISQLIPQCEAVVAKYVKRQIEQATFTQFYSGTGANVFFLRETPVQSITNLWVDDSAYFGTASGSFASSTLKTEGEDYSLSMSDEAQSMTGRVYNLRGTWPQPRAKLGSLLNSVPGQAMGNIKVEYVAGWLTVPEDIVLAVHQMIALTISTASSGQPLAGEGLDYYSYSRFGPDVISKALGSVESLLKPYKRLVI